MKMTRKRTRQDEGGRETRKKADHFQECVEDSTSVPIPLLKDQQELAKISKEKEYVEDGTSVPIPLLKEFLKPILEMLPVDKQSSSIRYIDQAQLELASNLKHTINDLVISRATSMARQLQAAVDAKKSASNSEDPVTSLGDGSPKLFLSSDHIGHPVTPSRDTASASPYAILSSRLSAIDVTKIPASAAHVLSVIRERASSTKKKGGKISTVELPDTCKELYEMFIEAGAKRNMTEQEKEQQPGTEQEKEQQPGTEKEQQPRTEKERETLQVTENKKETLQGNAQNIRKSRRRRTIPLTRRTNPRNIYNPYASPPLFNKHNVPTKDMVNEVVSLLCSSMTSTEEDALIRIKGVTIPTHILTEFLTNDKISVDIIRAFLICFRSDVSPGTRFFFLPQSLESIEGGALERDLSEAPSRDGKSIVGVKTQLIFVPVIAGDDRMFVFCYNSSHKKFEFLSCNNSSESWSEGDAICMTIFDKLESAIGKLSCSRKNCHVHWSSHMDKISDGSLLALLFMEFLHW